MSRKKTSLQTMASPRDWYRKKHWHILLGMVFIITIAFSVLFPVMDTTARTFDDDQYFFSNAYVQNPSWTSAKLFLSEVLAPSTVAGYYQPLSMISLMLDVAMGATENDVSIFHRTSLILHVMNSLFIFLILYILFERIWPAWATALLFSIHPMVIETIAWVGERKTTLAAFFGLAAVLFYLLSVKWRQARYRWLALICFLFALMAKPTVLLLPLGLLVLDWWPLNRINRSMIRSILIEKIPFFIVMIGFGLIAFVSQDRTSGTMTPGEQGGFDTIIYKLAYSVVQYVQHMIYPVHLTSHDPIPEPFHISNPEVMLVVLVATAITGIVLLSLKWTPSIFGAWLYTMIVLFPASGVIGFNNVIGSDKYIYFAVLGYLIGLCWLMISISDRLQAKFDEQKWLRRSGLLIVFIAIFIPLVISNQAFMAKWENTETYYRYMLQFAPKAAPLHYDLAMELMRQKRAEEAILAYEKSAKYAPDNNWIQTNLGIAYFESGRYDEAIASFTKSLELEPNDAFAANNLGILYLSKKDNVNALSWFIKATKINPKFYSALVNQGKIYAQMDMLDLAMKSFQEAYAINQSDPELNFLMGQLFERKGIKQNALVMYQRAQQLDPNFPKLQERIQALRASTP